jgi:hypothetical protein
MRTDSTMRENPVPDRLADAPTALVDLVSTAAPDQRDAVLSLITSAARSAGGRVTIVNRALAPMILPDESGSQADEEFSLLVISEYETGGAARVAIAQRDRDVGHPLSGSTTRTWATRPAGRIQSFVGHNLPRALALFGRASFPEDPSAAEQRVLIEGGSILGDESPDASRWQRLFERAGNRPIWMLNMLEFRAMAQYPEDAGKAAPPVPIGGAEAYLRYGRGMIGTLGAVGGRVGWQSGRLHQVGGPDEAVWHQLAIAVYPAPAAMLTMLAMPKYRAAHVHREAALARTRLLATRPLDERKEGSR